MNKKLLLKVKERILNEEIPVVMHTWFSVRPKDARKNWKNSPSRISSQVNWCSIDGYNGMTKVPSKDGIAEHGCQTAGCIAGHAIMEKLGGRTAKSLMKKYPGYVYCESTGEWVIDFYELGREALDLSLSEAKDLFIVDNWPDKFFLPYDLYMKCHKYKKANQVVADRIDYFIEMGE